MAGCRVLLQVLGLNIYSTLDIKDYPQTKNYGRTPTPAFGAAGAWGGWGLLLGKRPVQKAVYRPMN